MTTPGSEGAASPPTPGQVLADDLKPIEKRRPFRWGLVVGPLAAVAALLIVQNGQSTAVQSFRGSQSAT